MKFSILLLTMLASQIVSANTIDNSKHDQDHQQVITQAIQVKCGIPTQLFEQISSKETAIKIDNGITDYAYTTVVEARVRIDQGQYDRYTLVVESFYSDVSNIGNASRYSVTKIVSADVNCN